MASMPHFSSSCPSQVCTGPRAWSRDISAAGPGPGEQAEGLSDGTPPTTAAQPGRMNSGCGHPQSARHLLQAMLRWCLEGTVTPAKRREARHLGDASVCAGVSHLDPNFPPHARPTNPHPDSNARMGFSTLLSHGGQMEVSGRTCRAAGRRGGRRRRLLSRRGLRRAAERRDRKSVV